MAASETSSSPPTAVPPPSATVPTSTASTNPAPSIPNLLTLRDRIPKLQSRRRQQVPDNPTPVPETPPLPPPIALLQENDTAEASAGNRHVFAVPRRRILTTEDQGLFLASPACTLVEAWVLGLADAVIGIPAGVFADAMAAAEPNAATRDDAKHYQKTDHPQRPISPAVRALLTLLDDVAALVYANPPDDTIDEGAAPSSETAATSRFGNKRFRGFVDDVRRRAPQWHRSLLGISTHVDTDTGTTPSTSAVDEISAYLVHAFGNRARIDYGSGHELHFVVWLLCLYELGVVTAADRPALVLCVFARYLDVMRLVQQTYYLEPAGSHGVWGLDDYQFCPFLFGAAQLRGHRYLTPRAVHQTLLLEQFGDDYLYLGQVCFVNSIKMATASASASDTASSSLRWHSPMLDDISAAKSWDKIDGGMRRMFRAELLQKLPVMQHFLFGSLVPAASGMTAARSSDHALMADGVDEEDSDSSADEDNNSVDVFDQGGVRHIHNPSGWGDCCGIRVPSSLGAVGEMRKHGGASALRRIPFD